MQKSKQLAKNYARALMELANNDSKLQDDFYSSLKQLYESVSKVKDADKLFDSPAVSKEEKRNIVEKIFSKEKANKSLLNFLFLLIDNQRFNLIYEICFQLGELINKSKKIVIAEVTSANNIDSVVLENLKKTLERTFCDSGTVNIESKVEPELIGGLKVRINDLIYDGTIKGRLENLKRRLEI